MKGKFQQLQTSRDLIFELNLNKHPKDCKNLSLVDSRNIQLSEDLSTIQNVIAEEKGDLYYKLYNIYGGTEDSNKLNCVIVGTINCIEELVLFIRNNDNDLHIYRYKNNILSSQLINESEDYFLNIGNNSYIPEFTGTYTYNRNNELIISYCFSIPEDSDIKKQFPLSVANLGKWENDIINTTNLNMNVNTFPLCPETPIINPTSVSYEKGLSKKGWYNFYIRYKIDDNNYTKWISFDEPRYLDSFKAKKIYESKNSEGQDVSFVHDLISDEYDICNLTINFQLNFEKASLLNYNKYQIAFICSTKTYTNCRKTEDLIINKNDLTFFNLDYANSKEYDINNLIKVYNNYYNVKNIINYKNQLYISNYEEFEFNLNDLNIDSNIDDTGHILESNINNDIEFEKIERQIDLDVKGELSVYLFSKSNYYKNTVYDGITLSEYFNNSEIKNVFGLNQTYENNTTKPSGSPTDYYLVMENIGLGKGWKLYGGNSYLSLPNDHVTTWTVKRYTNIGLGYIYLYGNRVKIGDLNKDNLCTEVIILDNDYNPVEDFYYRLVTTTNDIYTINGLFDINDGYNENNVPILNINEIIKNDTSYTSHCLIPNSEYYFYINFINKYGEISEGKYLGKILSDNKFNVYQNIKVKINNKNINNNLNYFISYEKNINTLIYQGITKDDKFYSEELNYKDNVNLNLLYGIYFEYDDSVKYKFKIENREDLNYTNSYSFIILNNNLNQESSSVEKINYIVAGSTDDNNKNQNTHLKYKTNGLGLTYLYTKPNRNSYKTLIRCSNFINNIVDDFVIIIKGHLGYGAAIIYNKEYRINHENVVVDENNNALETTPMSLFRYPVFSYDFPESKQLNNNPQNYATIINNVTYDNPEVKIFNSKLFLVQDNVDLFKNNSLDYRDSVLNTYLSYENIQSKKVYNKTIRRSNYISDESLELSWRNFETENYKSIIENKGDIVNLIDFGNILLIHTEHSLFQINLDETIVANNRNIQLSSVDAFNVQYKEIFTDKNGIGGLSRKSNAIGGKFGYIYYSQEDNRFYRYDNGKLITIDDNINLSFNWMDDELKNDYSKLLTINYDKKRNIISFSDTFRKSYVYNLNTSNFITIKDTFKNSIYKNSFQYKDLLYIYVVSGVNTTLFNTGLDLYYNESENNKHKYSLFSIIINENYNKIKVLEYISYKLYKVNLKNAGSLKREPYSGYLLRVYNNMCDTGRIDIQTNLKDNDTYNKIDKPTYNLGNFNMSYLRDRTTNSQIFGNYFIVEFSFPADSNIKFEFESLDYAISEK